MVDLNKLDYNSKNFILESLEAKIKKYENEMIDKKYQLYLSNGENIYIKFNESSIPHILGVKSDGLKRLYNDFNGNSYRLLKRFINGGLSSFKKINDNNMKYSDVFSNYIDSKINIFDDNTRFNIKNIEFISKFDKSKCPDIEGQENFDYFVGTRTKDGKLILLGLVEAFDPNNVDKKYYVPRTSILIGEENGENLLKRYLSNQVITYPTNIKCFYNYEIYKTKKSDESDIYDAVAKLDAYSDAYGCFVDTNNVFKFTLNKVVNVYRAIDKICSCVLNGEKINLNELGKLPWKLVELAKKLNSLSLNEDGSAELAVSLSEEKTKLEQRIFELESENIKINKRNEELTSKVNELSQENSEYKSAYSEVEGILKRIKNNPRS